jgi:hypothetical protein
MRWRVDNQATQTAREVFPMHLPRVLSNGKRQYVVQPTPLGRVELVGFERGFVVAAETPPPGALVDESSLPQRLLEHLEANGLRAWKVVHSDDCSEAIRALVLADPEQPAPFGPEQPGLSGPVPIPFVSPIPSGADLLGETRRLRCEQLAGLAASQAFPGPLVQLAGPDGVGKRTMAAAVARQAGWSLVGELPLSRLLIDRALQTPVETALDAVLAAAAALGRDDLLVISDAELLERMEDALCRSVLRELARLPHVILLARPNVFRTDGLVTLECPGLEGLDDAGALVECEHPEVSFAGAALEMAARAASVRGVGVAPGRLLYLVRLAKALRPPDLADDVQAPGVSAPDKRGAERGEVLLAPDEISSATTLAVSAWAEDET